MSLTSLVCKTLEHVLVSQKIKHLETSEILVEVQYGYRFSYMKPSVSSLAIDDLTRALENKLQVDVAILDFEKAFDKVTHTTLIYKLHCYGTRGYLLQWVLSFYTNCK